MKKAEAAGIGTVRGDHLLTQRTALLQRPFIC